jgi:hypothetical protein
MTLTDWKAYPPLLDAHHISAIYGYTLKTTRKMFQQRNPKVPTPCQARPYKVRREDARRHYERLSI